MLQETVRDRRSMNHMDADTKLVHLRLEAWGKWAHEHQGSWPSVTLLGRIIKYGPDGAVQLGKGESPMPDEIAVIDALVARLCEIDRRALLAYYTFWEPPEACARRLHMRVRQFQNVLRRARWRVAAMLDAQFVRSQLTA